MIKTRIYLMTEDHKLYFHDVSLYIILCIDCVNDEFVNYKLLCHQYHVQNLIHLSCWEWQQCIDNKPYYQDCHYLVWYSITVIF